jgi:hypothetical protein
VGREERRGQEGGGGKDRGEGEKDRQGVERRPGLLWVLGPPPGVEQKHGGPYLRPFLYTVLNQLARLSDSVAHRHVPWSSSPMF